MNQLSAEEELYCFSTESDDPVYQFPMQMYGGFRRNSGADQVDGYVSNSATFINLDNAPMEQCPPNPPLPSVETFSQRGYRASGPYDPDPFLCSFQQGSSGNNWQPHEPHNFTPLNSTHDPMLFSPTGSHASTSFGASDSDSYLMESPNARSRNKSMPSQSAQQPPSTSGVRTRRSASSTAAAPPASPTGIEKRKRGRPTKDEVDKDSEKQRKKLYARKYKQENDERNLLANELFGDLLNDPLVIEAIKKRDKEFKQKLARYQDLVIKKNHNKP